MKENVYEPDWSTDERTQYTMNVAEILGDVAPPGTSPSIQSAPLAFKPRVTGPDMVARFTEHVMRVAARLVDIRERTGRTVGLALEPEPFCFLETTDETVDYFTKHLYSGAAAARLREARRDSRSRKPSLPCGVMSVSFSTSAIRPSSTKTSANRCRSS